MPFEDECVIVAPALAAVECEDGGGPVARDLGRVPLPVVDVDGRQPDLLLLGAQRVEVVAEAQPRVLDLQDAVLPVVLVRHPEQLAVLLPRPDAEENAFVSFSHVFPP